MAKLNKKLRQEVYDKYNGHCAYCGCEIEIKDMQVDHIVPKFRNNEMWHQGEICSDDISNLNPSCRMCNYYKRMDSLEGFRERLTDILIRNVRRPFDYRLALKYGLVKEDVKKVKFYFESQGVKVKEIKTIEERADVYVGHPFEIDEFSSATAKRQAFIDGAKEQRKIDIDKACIILCRYVCPHKTDDSKCLKDKCYTWKMFRRMMEE